MLTLPLGECPSSFFCLVKSFKFCWWSEVGDPFRGHYIYRAPEGELAAVAHLKLFVLRRALSSLIFKNFKTLMIKCLVSHRKTKSSKASQCLTTAVHQLIHLMLAAAACHTCCRLFLPFAIKRTQYRVPVWLLSLLWFKKEKEQRACNQIPNHLIWQRWAIGLKAKSAELGRGNENPDGAEYPLGTLMFTVMVKSRAGHLLLCPSLLPFNGVVKKSNRRWVLLCPAFKAVAGVSAPQGLWLGEVFICCTLAHVTLPCWQIYAEVLLGQCVQNSIRASCIHLVHMAVLLRAEERPQIHW